MGFGGTSGEWWEMPPMIATPLDSTMVSGATDDLDAAHYTRDRDFSYPRCKQGLPEIELYAAPEGEDPRNARRHPAALPLHTAHDGDKRLGRRHLGWQRPRGGRGLLLGRKQWRDRQVGQQRTQLIDRARPVRQIDASLELLEGQGVLCKVLTEHLNCLLALRRASSRLRFGHAEYPVMFG